MKTFLVVLVSMFTITLVADEPPPPETKKRIGQILGERFPRNFHVKGESFDGRPCLVVFDYFTRNTFGRERGMVRTDFEFSIYNNNLDQTGFYGSWHWQGGRGGCGSIAKNHASHFHFRQDSGAGAPCFARPNKLFFYSGDLYVTKLASGETLFEMQKDGVLRSTQCILPKGRQVFK